MDTHKKEQLDLEDFVKILNETGDRHKLSKDVDLKMLQQFIDEGSTRYAPASCYHHKNIIIIG